MTNCDICNTPFTSSQYADGNVIAPGGVGRHRTCVATMKVRTDNGLCGWCGENLAVNQTACCKTCSGSPNPKGFTAPQ